MGASALLHDLIILVNTLIRDPRGNKQEKSLFLDITDTYPPRLFSPLSGRIIRPRDNNHLLCSVPGFFFCLPPTIYQHGSVVDCPFEKMKMYTCRVVLGGWRAGGWKRYGAVGVGLWCWMDGVCGGCNFRCQYFWIYCIGGAACVYVCMFMCGWLGCGDVDEMR